MEQYSSTDGRQSTVHSTKVVVGDGGIGSVVVDGKVPAGASQPGSPAMMVSSQLVTPSLTVGENSTGELTISNGAQVGADEVVVGGRVAGSVLMQDGDLKSDNVWIGGRPTISSSSGSGNASLRIEQGLLTTDSLGLGGFAPGKVVVDTATGTSNFDLNIDTDGLTVGLIAPGELQVLNGAVVEAGEADFGSSLRDTGTANVLVSGARADGARAQLLVEGTLDIGSEADSTLTVGNQGIVHVDSRLNIGFFGEVALAEQGVVLIGDPNFDSGVIRANGEMYILPGGTLTGTGLIRTEDFNEDGGVNNFGGVMLPGVSPGILTIEGDFSQGPAGTTVLEVGGSPPGEHHDQIRVTGDVNIEGEVILPFIDGFAPEEGDTFELLNVGGDLQVIGTSIGIEGLEDGFEFDLGLDTDGTWPLTALNDGVFAGSVTPDPSAVPEPSSCLIWAVLVCCFGWAGRRRLLPH